MIEAPRLASTVDNCSFIRTLLPPTFALHAALGWVYAMR